jgi:hypothetical protein
MVRGRVLLKRYIIAVTAIFLSMSISLLYAQETTYKVLNPRGFMPEVQLTPLASRPSDLNDKTVYLLTSKQEGSHIEVVLAKVAEELTKRFPGVKIINKYKPSAYMTNDPELWDEMVRNGQAFVYGAAPSCSTTHWSTTWAAGLEKRGLPGVVIVYDTLIDTVKITSEMKGTPVRWVPVNYPPQKMTEKQMADATDKAIKALTTAPIDNEKKTGKYTPPRPPKYAPPGTYPRIQEYFYKQGWTDGLPIVLPTQERVTAMLRGTKHKRDEVVATSVWPEKWTATIEKVAINGVMAGCRPEYMPVLLATVEAWANWDNDSTIRSTNSFSYMQVVNGPIRKEIDMNPGIYAMGPGNQANATIGRALRLFIINLGGGQAGVNMMATQGNPSAYSFCFPENEEASPWGPLSADLGSKPGESTVTIFSGGWCHVGNYLSGNLDSLIRAIRYFEWPNGVVVLMAPQAAKLHAQKGSSKNDVKDYIWKNATLTMKEFKSDVYYSWFIEPILKGKEMYGQKYLWPKEYLTMSDDAVVQIYPRQNIYIVVVGGETNPMMQGWRFAYPSTASVDKWR